MRRTSRKSRLSRVQIIQGFSSLLFFFIPCFSYIAYSIGVTGFVPTLQLKPVANVVAVISAFIYAFMLWPSTYRELSSSWTKKDIKAIIKNGAFLIFGPFMGWAMAHVFFVAPVSYSMHQMQSKPVTSNELKVVYADDFGGRGCRNRAVLNNETFFWRREVCGISDAAVVKLRRGGWLNVEGTVSEYGMQVQRYIVSDDTRTTRP